MTGAAEDVVNEMVQPCGRPVTAANVWQQPPRAGRCSHTAPELHGKDRPTHQAQPLHRRQHQGDAKCFSQNFTELSSGSDCETAWGRWDTTECTQLGACRQAVPVSSQMLWKQQGSDQWGQNTW